MLAPILLLIALSAPASAEKLPDCIHVSTTAVKLRYKPDLDSVRDCQDLVRQKLIDDAKAKGKTMSATRLEKIDDQQRAEVRDYLANAGVILEGESRHGQGLGGIADKDRSRVSAEENAEISSLEKRLHAAAGDGKDGITPAMGRDIIDSLTKKQGFISPDMKDLLDSVVRDAGKLTPETMKKLQGAGRSAKGAGMDLNIDKNTEKELLEHDFDKDKDVASTPPADPGNL